MLKADGALKGNILSAHGTLLMTASGQVQADVDVRVAIIDGYLEGNLRATEHVVLKSNARVAGDIHMPSLSIRDGAVFEGNSFFSNHVSTRKFAKPRPTLKPRWQ